MYPMASKTSEKHTTLFMIIMRLNLKYVLSSLILMVTFVTLMLWHRCDFVRTFPKRFYTNQYQITEAVEIDCVINAEYSIGCRKSLESDEVYLPFSFLKKYFEVYGSLQTSIDGVTHFEWQHSYGKVNLPRSVYDPKGIFMYFENYNVEVRDRVKCIDARSGVPISTQWESQGYYYATQIAQFGLSHYSKNLTEPEPSRKIIEDGDESQGVWIIPRNSTILRKLVSNNAIVNFSTSNQFESAIYVELDHAVDLILSVDLNFQPNSSLTVTMQNRETQQLYYLHYIVADLSITVQDANIYHGIGTNSVNKWKHLTRDLYVDVQKGIAASTYSNHRQKMRRNELKVVRIAFLGNGAFDNLTLCTSEHITHFYDAAEWFVHHQNQSTGGFAIPVRRRLASGFEDLPRGWYSAMSQGHAISLLSRAYYYSGLNKKFLKAAVNALKPFKQLSSQGGVLAHFMNQLPWYEEYPTTPGSFVLNGFIYSLLGLYDLNQIAPKTKGGKEAGILFDQGMESLKRMLTLFDTGSGSVYDLRHFSLGSSPNLARWDYHVTHVNQLLLLATIDDDPIFSQTAERWKGYMVGKRAMHN